MRKILSLVLGLLFIASSVMAAGPYPNKEFGENLGKDGRSYNHLYLSDEVVFEGSSSDAYETTFVITNPTADRTITFQNGTGTVAFTSDVSTAAPAVNAVTGAAADTTIAFTAYQGTFTSTLTNKDMFTFQGLGAFGDVSVMRIEQKTGNATDGTVLEVVSADANVDPLVVSSSAQAGVLTVGQGGTVSIIGATDITGAFGVTGASTFTGSLATTGATTLGNASTTVAVNSSDWKVTTAGVMTGIDAITMDGLLTAALGADISGAVINLNAASNFATNINTGASSGTVTIGGGSGLVAINSSDWDITSAGAMTGIGAITMDGLLTGTAGATITGAAISLNASSNFGVNIATGTSTGTVAIGGTGIMAIDIGTGGTGAKTITIGDAASTGTTAIKAGSGGVNINASNGTVATNIGTGTSTGTISLGGTGIMAIDIGTGGTGAKTITIGDAASTGTTAIKAGSGGVNINASNGTVVTNVGTGTTSGAVAIGGGSNTVAVASTTWDVSTAGAFSGVTGVTMAPGAASTITLAADGAADDLTISVTGAQNSSLVLSSAGTAADALDVKTTAGGMLFTASGAMADQFKVSAAGTIAGNAINLVTTDGGIVLTGGGAVNGDVTITAGDAFTMNATGTAAITSSDWGISTTGVVTKLASIGFDSSTTIHHATVACNNACIKALRAAPKELVAAPAAGYFIELVSAVLILDYGTNVLTESVDDMVIEYGAAGTDATAAIEATGFIDASADTIKIVQPAGIANVAATSLAASNLRLLNTGDGEYAGNAGNDTVMTIKVAYRVHPTGL